MSILQFITALRESDEYIQHIYQCGGCYQFHLLLNKIFPGCVPLINQKKNHVVSLYDGTKYDITGIAPHDEYFYLTDEDMGKVVEWSFSGNNLINLSECPYCEEPLLYDVTTKSIYQPV